MLVTRERFRDVVDFLSKQKELGLDTETTGLRVYHGHRAFSVIISFRMCAFYFNFKPYNNAPPNAVLDGAEWMYLNGALFANPEITWFIQNAANFDMPIIARQGYELAGRIWCTRAIGRVVYNDHMKYSLEAQLERIGRKKSDAIKEYCDKHKLYTQEKIPGKQTTFKNYHFHLVPFEVIVPYGEKDGQVYALGKWQQKQLELMDKAEPNLVASNRSIMNVVNNEIRLQKTIFRMKERGVKIDREYCIRAIKYESDKSEQFRQTFKSLTGRDYSASGKLFETVFADQRAKWKYTDKGNPSFKSKVLRTFGGPVAEAVLELRASKAASDFYQGFLYHADENDRVHPNYNPDTTVHGRFSSSEPNFQNLSNEEDEAEDLDFIVRSAIIPEKGCKLLSLDFKQMEYVYALEQACRLKKAMTPLAEMINSGYDFHDATQENVKKIANMDLPRRPIKIANFLTLYGGGPGAMAEQIGIPYREAMKIQHGIFSAAPEIKDYIDAVTDTAQTRGFIVNWLGRRCHFPNRRFAYKATNYHVSGGCADIAKVAMNRIDELLLGYKTKMVMMVHDELIFEVAPGEEFLEPILKEIMENVYIGEYVKLRVDGTWYERSLGDVA